MFSDNENNYCTKWFKIISGHFTVSLLLFRTRARRQTHTWPDRVGMVTSTSCWFHTCQTQCSRDCVFPANFRQVSVYINDRWNDRKRQMFNTYLLHAHIDYWRLNESIENNDLLTLSTSDTLGMPTCKVKHSWSVQLGLHIVSIQHHMS